ncbi:MAG: hypothetical protein AABZ47_13395, partial [Planctomycetota bacterium]
DDLRGLHREAGGRGTLDRFNETVYVNCLGLSVKLTGDGFHRREIGHGLFMGLHVLHRTLQQGHRSKGMSIVWMICSAVGGGRSAAACPSGRPGLFGLDLG